MENTIIFIIEDQEEEAVLAEAAVKNAFGISPAEEGVCIGLNSLREKLNLPDWKGYKADEAILSIMVARNLKEAMNGFERVSQFGEVFSRVGIITDLMFPGTTGSVQANGIEVILIALEKKIPVAVCSDTNHHDVGFMPLLASTLSPLHPAGKIPVILDKKDWEKAVAEVVAMLS